MPSAKPAIDRPSIDRPSIDRLCIDTIRTLAMDAVQKAESGHPGTPMALAPVAYTVWQNVLRYDPAHAAWPNRDRFVLSNGHASMLLYALLHLAGVKTKSGEPAVSLDDIKQFRQLDSRCPGHPEYGHTTGVETTTGPLGQGCGNSVGMAMAQRWLAQHYNQPDFKLFDYNVYAMCGDGDMMEGISNEAASIAGHLMLGNLCWIYDNNTITIEGHTNLAFSDDVAARFLAYGWNVQRVGDANDTGRMAEALAAFRNDGKVPNLIIVDSHIGYGAPHKQDTAAAHGEALGEEEVKLAKRFYGWPEDAHFLVPDGVRAQFDAGIGQRGAALYKEWRKSFDAYRGKYPEQAAQIEAMQDDALPDGWDSALPTFPADAKGIASRDAGGKAINAIAAHYPWLLGGAADLSPSTKTNLTFEGAGAFEAGKYGGRNLHFGIREHAMGAIVNGMTVSKLRAYGSSFLVFSDYMKPAIRLSALMGLPAIFVFTHDSIGLGEDGPTHQPVEQLVGLRAIPGLVTLRPGDANETVEAWRSIITLHQPVCLVLSRQALPTLDRKRYASAEGVARGAYVLADAADAKPEVVLIGTGSELSLCVAAYEKLKQDGVAARVVSMPSWELFEQQDQAYRDQVLPPEVTARVSVEAGSPIGWDRYVGRDGARIGMTSFGASAPLKDVMARFGFTPDKVIAAAKAQLAQVGKPEPKAKSRKEKIMNPLKALHQQGQAPWLDFLARKFVAEGKLKQLVDQDGLTGVTSNPSIFEKAIGESSDYDAALKAALAQSDGDAMALYEGLAIADIQHAADVLRPVYDRTKRHDGYVSLEVSPYLAMDTAATIAEAQRLWQAVGRPNVMIKVPGTTAGLPAIRTLIGQGININITLLFSQKIYEQVIEAYLAGLEHLLGQGGDPGKVASVASIFVSRIDVAVEKLIDQQEKDGKADRKMLDSLRGKVAIANAKLSYRSYQRLFAGARWDKLQAMGAHAQRLLWASTGRKNKAYSDVLYVEQLIGPDTVNTMPPETMDAFRDHGKVQPRLIEDLVQAEQVMASLKDCGISIDQVTDKLVEDGVQAFADSFDKLLGAVARKRASILGRAMDTQQAKLPGELDQQVKAAVEDWRKTGKIRRLWAGDAALWTGHDEGQWLGWLTIVTAQQKQLARFKKLSEDAKGFTHILLLGMGGSSLGPEVLAKTFAGKTDGPQLLVLDSTDPAQVQSFADRIDAARTLFIVSSKSGSTLEPNILKQFFFAKATAAVGAERAGGHFIAVTDPDSSLQKLAQHDKFRDIFLGEPSIGGRYSVLSEFGTVPGAAMGVDLAKLLATAQAMVHGCAPSVPAGDNPGVMLGAILGVLGKAGHDKVTVVASPGIADFGFWLEQLLAESTGKQGKGLIPVADEPLGKPEAYGRDRLFIYMRLTAEADAQQDAAVAALEQAGQPVVRIALADRYDIGQEFFRWEMATAVAGAILNIDPFNQPDVEASKIKTRELTTAYEKSGKLPAETPLLEEAGFRLFADAANAKQLTGAGARTLADVLKAHFARLQDGDYAALLAYIERNVEHTEVLQEMRRLIRDRKRVATCLGFGPRFLHSTGQAYKGGPNSGVFLQITCDDAADLAVPGQKYSFGTVKAAEARGDFEVLAERQRRLLRVHLGADVTRGLVQLRGMIEQALA